MSFSSEPDPLEVRRMFKSHFKGRKPNGKVNPLYHVESGRCNCVLCRVKGEDIIRQA